MQLVRFERPVLQARSYSPCATRPRVCPPVRQALLSFVQLDDATAEAVVGLPNFCMALCNALLGGDPETKSKVGTGTGAGVVVVMEVECCEAQQGGMRVELSGWLPYVWHVCT